MEQEQTVYSMMQKLDNKQYIFLHGEDFWLLVKYMVAIYSTLLM